jgi:uncharacterized protein
MATLTMAAAAVGPLSNGGATLAVEGDAGASAPAARFALHSIIVIGQGRATAKPDTALATIGVEVVGKSLQEASDQNNAKMDALLKALKASGVADKDIQTVGYSVSPERKYNRDTGPGEITSFRIVNQVRVKLRDLKKVGATLDRAIKEGANTLQGLVFEADDPTPIRARASAAAIVAARSKAEEMAKAAGVKLGEVLQISEVIGEPRPMPMMDRAMAASPAGRAVPIEQGELEFTAQLQVIYAIR